MLLSGSKCPPIKISSFDIDPIVQAHKQNKQTMWSVYPKGQEFDAEYFTSEDHAVDVAYSWSAEEHGQTMIVARNDIEWMEVTC